MAKVSWPCGGALASNVMPTRTMGMPPSPHPLATASRRCGEALASNVMPTRTMGMPSSHNIRPGMRLGVDESGQNACWRRGLSLPPPETEQGRRWRIHSRRPNPRRSSTFVGAGPMFFRFRTSIINGYCTGWIECDRSTDEPALSTRRRSSPHGVGHPGAGQAAGL
jgi:hypothetical protein